MDFCTGVIIFRFGGPDSGQKIRKGLELKVRVTKDRRFGSGQLFKGFVVVRKIF